MKIKHLALACAILLSCVAPPRAEAQPTVVMSLVNGQWQVTLPNGSILNTSTSTSQGLQEAFNWAQGHNVCLEIYGGAQSGSIDPRIATTQTIWIPPSAKTCIRAYEVTLWCVHASGDCIDIAAQDMADIYWSGQIVHTGLGGSAVGLFAGGTYYEGSTAFSVFTASRVHLGSVVCAQSNGTPGSPATGVSMNPNGNGFTGNTVQTVEIHGCATPAVIYNTGGDTSSDTYSWGWVH